MNKTIRLKITGMTCASCVLHIENDLKELDGVEEAVINLPLKNGSVTFDPDKINEHEIIHAVKKAGYKAIIIQEGHMHDSADHAGHAEAEDKAHVHERFIKLVVSAIFSAAILTLGFVWKPDIGMEIMMVLAFAILVYSGRDFFIKGISDLIKGRPGMDTLVALGTGAAFFYSVYLTVFAGKEEEYFMDVALITTFILLGRYLEARAKGKAGSAIRKLLELSAKEAHRIGAKGEIEDIPADQVQTGDRLLVKPGEKIPTDGLVIEGYATLDESMVTGESMPVDKKEGDKVIGATLNGNTSFTIQATKVGADTVLSQIIKMVEDAQMHKAPIQKLVDVVAGYFVWGVIAIALITFFGWSYIHGGFTTLSIPPVVAVLIIACPCALGLATPISIVVGSGKGAQMGILIKKTESLEKAHKITAIAFDKTGTITKGHPEVQEFEVLSGEKADALGTAYSLEINSEHPLAKSIVSYCKSGTDLSSKANNFKSLTGLGVKGEINGKTYHLGSGKYMEELGVIDDSSAKLINKWHEKGYTVLSLADDNRILAVFGVQDGVKDTSKEAISMLKKRGIRTIMLTGDNEKVAKKIAKDVGIDEVHHGATPEEKKDVIKKLQKEGLFVAMAGDGINDSPALAQADIGIAMGTGTDIAMETGDIVIVKGDLMKAVDAIELSRATLRNIKQNLFWAFIYNSIGIPLAALGFLNPMISAAAMSFSSVSVVLNALRLRRFRAHH